MEGAPLQYILYGAHLKRGTSVSTQQCSPHYSTYCMELTWREIPLFPHSSVHPITVHTVWSSPEERYLCFHTAVFTPITVYYYGAHLKRGTSVSTQQCSPPLQYITMELTWREVPLFPHSSVHPITVYYYGAHLKRGTSVSTQQCSPPLQYITMELTWREVPLFPHSSVHPITVHTVYITMELTWREVLLFPHSSVHIVEVVQLLMEVQGVVRRRARGWGLIVKLVENLPEPAPASTLRTTQHQPTHTQPQ